MSQWISDGVWSIQTGYTGSCRLVSLITTAPITVKYMQRILIVSSGMLWSFVLCIASIYRLSLGCCKTFFGISQSFVPHTATEKISHNLTTCITILGCVAVWAFWVIVTTPALQLSIFSRGIHCICSEFLFLSEEYLEHLWFWQSWPLW